MKTIREIFEAKMSEPKAKRVPLDKRKFKISRSNLGSVSEEAKKKFAKGLVLTLPQLAAEDDGSWLRPTGDDRSRLQLAMPNDGQSYSVGKGYISLTRVADDTPVTFE